MRSLAYCGLFISFSLIALGGFLRRVQANFLSIYLESPTNGDNIFLHNEDTGTVPIQYSLYGIQHESKDSEKYEFCFEISMLSTGVKSVPFTCMETIHRRLELANFRAGQYTITAVLREKETKNVLDYTRIVNSFNVIAYADILPVIDIPVQAGDIHVAANAGSGLAAVDIPFSILPSSQQSSFLDIGAFTVCATVEDRATQQVLVSWTCLKNADRALSLNQLQPGHAYEVHLRLRDTSNADRSPKSLLASTEVVRTVVIRELLPLAPSIALLPQTPRDYGVDTVEGTVSLQFHYALQYPSPDVFNVENQLFVCLHLRHSTVPFAATAADDTVSHADVTTTTTTVIIPYSCVPAKNDYISVPQMKRGYYQAELSVSIDQRQRVAESTSLLSTDASPRSVVFNVDVRPMEEFTPTYEWQPLHAWHTIPSGIETRLPIGDARAARKEARISDPWRLQLPLPNKLCKKAYFLRMDVHRTTTMETILQEIARQCGPHPSHAHGHHRRHRAQDAPSSQTQAEGEGDGEAAGSSSTSVSKDDAASAAVDTTTAPEHEANEAEPMKTLSPTCFALAIHSKHAASSASSSPSSEGIDHDALPDELEERIFTVPPATEEDVLASASASASGSPSTTAQAATVESVDLFNAAHKEIRWIGSDHPDHCPSFEIL
jgi:hypothetical protein